MTQPRSKAARPNKLSAPCSSSSKGAISRSNPERASEAASARTAANVESKSGKTVSRKPLTPTSTIASTTTSARPGWRRSLRRTKRSRKPGLMMTRARLCDVLGCCAHVMATRSSDRSALTQCSSIDRRAASFPGRSSKDTMKRSKPGSSNISVTNSMALSREAICAKKRHMAASRFNQVTNLQTPGCCTKRMTKALASSCRRYLSTQSIKPGVSSTSRAKDAPRGSFSHEPTHWSTPWFLVSQVPHKSIVGCWNTPATAAASGVRSS
mmetsp:Transcript_87518/g.220207  ORF Transcript_87518/g.220207 Transcript_87518/m.220207 type:complete len:268 (-) Transcript_87518:1053-1856(-)